MVRVLLRTVLITVVALVTGVLTTIAWPAEVETPYYAASVHLSPDVSERGSIRSETIVGEIGVRFRGLAPGIVVAPRVKPEITDVLGRTGLDVAALTPTDAERERAVADAAKGVALRMALGAAAGCAIVLLGPALWRHGWPRRRDVVVAVAAWVIAFGGTALSIQRTYSPERVTSFTSTGLLDVLVANRALLQDVEHRAEQATPYLKNLLALSAALRQQYSPTDLDQAPALRILLVSDIHAANQYPLMRAVVEDQDIDLVIDSGDLINLGAVEEADLSGLFAGIESLRVPYVFVRGNHDANVPGVGPLVTRLRALDNVVLLQPEDRQYQELTHGGLRISGFNDPRYYGDADDEAARDQSAAREAYLAAFEGRPAPDLLVSHEEPAVDGIEAGVRIHGHGHVPRLAGNRIEVGTFTGGGLLSHFVTSGPDAELTSQPNSFDVLSYGSGCQLVSLTRYQYRQILEGRPTYDSVSIVNGAGIVEPPDDRVCGGDDHEVTVVPAAP